MTRKLTPGLAPLTLGLAALGLAGAHPAAATQTIYNFQIITQNAYGPTPYAGSGALTGSGTYWNMATQGSADFTSGAAADSNNDPVTGDVALTVANAQFTYSNAGAGSVAPSNPNALFTDYDGNGGGAVNFSLSGLATDTPYTLYLYGADNYGEKTAFTVANGTAVNPTGAGAAVTATTNTAGTASFTYGSNYVVFQGLTDGSGDISGTFAGNPPGYGPLNGLQVQVGSAAPEPSQIGMMALMGLGLGGLMLRAKRRSAAA